MHSVLLKMSVVLAVFAPICAFAEESAQESAKPLAGQLYVGWAQRSITPDEPVALWGQMYLRVSKGVLDPVTCTALAIETKDGEKSLEQALMVSCDMVGVTREVQDKVRERIEGKLQGFDKRKLFINATHTHTAPILPKKTWGWYEIPKEGLMQPEEYLEFLVARIVEAAAEAWEKRQPAQVSWALGQAIVGHNRRPTYFDGKAKMYGDATKDNFKDIEGYEDHGLEMLFFWDGEKKLTGMLLNVACPSQETEHLYEISADYWCEVREGLRKQYGKELYVFPQCGAAGDNSPHLIFRKKAEAQMLERKGISSRQEIANRIINAVNEVYPFAGKPKSHVIFAHKADNINLPVKEKGQEPLDVELHVLRLDDIAICTNPFELYLDYGIRMKARSAATLTMVCQLTGDYCGYLPTEKAVAGGGYSAEKYTVGPEGGTMLVNETVARINEMWGR
jgi:hypothetical protein